ncbi:MAG: hypothetical protein RR996_03680, partial [Alistipes sp.]
MTPKDIKNNLQKFSIFIEEWITSGEIAAIDRDLALDQLKALYEALRMADIQPVAPIVAPRPTETTEGADATETESIDLDDVLSVDMVEFEVETEDVEEALFEEEPETLPELEEEVIATEDEAVEKIEVVEVVAPARKATVAPQPEAPTLFETD